MIIKLLENRHSCACVRAFYCRMNPLYDFSYMEDLDELRLKLAEYKAEHKALDDMIEQSIKGGGAVNLMQIQQLKKKKLWLKDVIQKLESALIDDIIA